MEMLSIENTVMDINALLGYDDSIYIVKINTKK